MEKVVLITGGGRGIGKKLVEDFAKSNYKVFFCYNKSEDESLKLKSKLLESGYDVDCFKADIKDKNRVKIFVDKVIERYGRIDILINNSATTNDSLFQDKTSEDFMAVLETNLIGTFNVCNIVGNIMYKQKCGKIINISSTNSINTYFPMCLEYDASKAGINSLTHNLSVQFSPYVMVNAVAPGFIKTESEIKDMDEDFIKSEEEKILLKRAGTEEDVSNFIMFMASDKCNFINNQIIKINGGMYGDF